MTSLSLVFDPHLPWPVLLVAAILAALALGWGLWRRAKGIGWRLAFLTLLLLALARRAVLQQEDGVGELLALLAAERGVGQRQEQEGEEGEAPADTLGTAPQAPAEGECGEDGGREQDGPGKMGVEDEAE